MTAKAKEAEHVCSKGCTVPHIWGETSEGYAARVKAHNEAPPKDQIQWVYITLDDGRVLTFYGKAHSDIEGLRVTGVKFSEPRDLPEGCHLEALK